MALPKTASSVERVELVGIDGVIEYRRELAARSGGLGAVGGCAGDPERAPGILEAGRPRVLGVDCTLVMLLGSDAGRVAAETDVVLEPVP